MAIIRMDENFDLDKYDPYKDTLVTTVRGTEEEVTEVLDKLMGGKTNMPEYKTISLIKKNDVIKAIGEEALNVTRNMPWSVNSKEMARNTLYALKQTVQAMPEIETRGWISVKERMPPLKEKVLVWAVGKSKLTRGKTYCDVTFTAEVMGEIRWWEFWLWFLEDWEITHWMPLPEAPEEYKKNDSF